jgi:hypothetical protein
LQHSSPPLQRLSVHGVESSWTTDMDAYFRLMSALTHLEFRQLDAPGPADTFLADLVELLALRSIRFVLFAPRRARCKVLLGCLSARP